MAFTNQMTTLLNKIERRLGTALLNLPNKDPDLSKTAWGHVIEEDTLPTFSRFFPYKFPYIVNANTPRKDNCYLIDESVAPGVQIIGIKDIDWGSVSNGSISQQLGNNFYSDAMMTNFSIGDIGLAQVQMDTMSLFNMGYFIEYAPPNMFRIKNSMNADVGTAFNGFKIELHVIHKSILTIEPTKMETFEKLATADIASFLYNTLKYFDGETLETVFARTDMKLSDIENKASMRDDIVAKLEESYVSAANVNQPMIICM